MDLLSDYPYWLLKSGIPVTFPSLAADQKTDVVVMGAGITGALTAWHLCKKGFKVTVVDRRHVGMGSTSASTSLIQYEIDTPLHRLIAMHGEKNATSSYQCCLRAISQLEKICNSLSHEVEFDRKPSFQFASKAGDRKALRLEWEARKKAGISVQWLEAADILEKFGFNAPAGIFSRDGAQVDAYKLTHSLLRDCQKRGAEIFDTTEICRIRYHKKHVELTSDEGRKIFAKHLVIACGYESQKYVPKKIQQINSTYALVSEPLPGGQLWHKNSLIWETAVPYLYLRTTRDNRVVIGGKDDPFYDPARRKRNISVKVKALEKSFFKLFPRIPFKTDFQWSGAFASTKDSLPFIGSIPQRSCTSFALGFGGNGITFSVIAARIITDSLLGRKNPDSELFSFDR